MTFERIQAAAVDGRAHNIFYRQQQLESLCRILLENAERIRQAITSDTGNTLSEVVAEFHLTLTAVRSNYAALQPKKSHEEEYAVANGKDAPSSTSPVGIVCIEPNMHTLFYSTIVPLSAAIAAGNCVVVVLENNLRAVSNLLRQLLPSALAVDTFAIASRTIADQDFLSKTFIVQQNGSDIPYAKTNQLISLPRSKAIAIVDRTANFQVAAKEIVAARFSFGAGSPYAPDVVLVNEFAKKDFLQAVVAECVNRGSGVDMNGTVSVSSTKNKVNEKIEGLKQANSQLRVVVQESAFAVVDTPSRLDKIPDEKHFTPVLIVCSVKSLDDAIDLAGKSVSGPYLAAYHFSNLRSAKYLSQFIDVRVAFVNHIPRELLLGPTFPIDHPIDLAQRYPTSLFELARPVLVRTSTQSALLSAVLQSPDSPMAQQLWKTAVVPLAPMKRSKGGAVGFFEQGFLINAALILTSTIAISTTGAWYLWRYTRTG